MEEQLAKEIESILLLTADVVEAITVQFDDAAIMKHDDPTPPSIKGQVAEIVNKLNSVSSSLHASIDKMPQVARLPKAPYVPLLAQQNMQEAIGLWCMKANSATAPPTS